MTSFSPAPVGVTPPYEAKHYTGYHVEFHWLAPVSTSGMMTKFVLKAYNLDNTTLDPVEALFTNTSKREGSCLRLFSLYPFSLRYPFP
ncbi:hypothetical protein DPMN_089006 [Dreissena polymorpha]|uniref:Uncharacterized protein n=1 Tax=Dreissena polymorpha TaxID=45954 RepID=A0A9D4QX15_DREPO|nr:hypothetical protein DPMN_089006 [Dreissena polymorpha]